MSYYGSWKIDDTLTFTVNTHAPATGAATDADAVPAYRLYEDETATPILTGNMALLDTANTTGFYSEQLTLSAANGLEKGKSYNIYISAAVGAITGTMSHTFQMEAEVDAPKFGTPAADISADIAAVKAETATIVADTNELQTDDVPGLIAALNDVAATDIVSAGAITTLAGAVVNVDVVDTTTTNTDMRGTDSAALASVATEARLAELDGANLPADVAAVKAETALIVADTNELQTDWADAGRLDTILDARSSQATADAIEADTQDLQGRIPAALVGGRIDADIGAVSTSTGAATKMEQAFESVVTGVVGVGSTTTAIVLTSTDPSLTVNDQPNGKIITFTDATTTAALRGQSSDITDYDQGTVTVTVTALTTAPVSGDTFIVT